MAQISGSQLIDGLQWRYATKRFDPSRKISAGDWAALEESLVLTPSSFGLQPWRFLVITDPVVKSKLRPHSWDQSQTEDCSHLVVFAARRSMSAEDVDAYVRRVAKIRNVDPASLSGYRNMMVQTLLKESFDLPTWAAKQVYIALGNFMTSAALMGIDTCPMEGLVPAKFDEVLGLTGSEFATVVACPAGYRSPEDKYATLAKVRNPKNEVVVRI